MGAERYMGYAPEGRPRSQERRHGASARQEREVNISRGRERKSERTHDGAFGVRNVDEDPAKDFGDDTGDRGLHLLGNVLGERAEGLDDIGAEGGVGKVERGDEEGEKLQRGLVSAGISSEGREADLGKLRERHLLGDVLEEARKSDEEDGLVGAC